jgi:hypothetical protein
MPRIAIGVLLLASVPGCYDNIGTGFEDTGVLHFPDGAPATYPDGAPITYPDGALIPDLSPWEIPNQAMLPAATATDPCPENMLNQVEIHTWAGGHIADVHAAGCIHAPPAMVWIAIQDPETAHDPGSTNSFGVVRPPTSPTECEGPYETMINAGPAGFTVDFRLCWLHGLIAGTDAMPMLTETRWQKVWGSAAIRTLEGSLVSQPHPGSETTITEVYYQYHLDSASLGPSNFQTIHDYLGVIFSRLTMRAHGTML